MILINVLSLVFEFSSKNNLTQPLSAPSDSETGPLHYLTFCLQINSDTNSVYFRKAETGDTDRMLIGLPEEQHSGTIMSLSLVSLSFRYGVCVLNMLWVAIHLERGFV